MSGAGRDLGATPRDVERRAGLEQLLAAARAAALEERELALALVLEQLRAGTAAQAGLLVGFERDGRESARAAHGGFDAARAAALLRRAAEAGQLIAEAGAIATPLRLDARPLALVYLEGVSGRDAPGFAEHEARASVALGNATLVGDANARAELLAVLGHEVRNPLAGILGFSDLLPEEAGELPAKYIHLMDHIQDDAQRLKRLIETLLELLRAEAQTASVGVNVRELGGALATRFAGWAEAKRVRLVLAAAPLTALADAERLGLALANLLANALAATPPEGQITIGATREVVTAAERLPWGAAAATVRIEVSDTGPGLPAAARTSLADDARGGGLFIVRDVLRQLGGAVWSEDAQSGGARICLRLPAVP